MHGAPRRGDPDVILVTGASGYIGSHATKTAAGGGEPVRAFVRPGTGSEELAFLRSLGAEVAFGEAEDPEAVSKALAGCRAVIHCVGGIQPSRRGDFRSLHQGPAEALAQAASQEGPERIVLVSAVGVSPGAASAYHRTKARAEEILREAFPQTAIVRPSLVYGHSGGLRDSKLMVRLTTYLRGRKPLPLAGGGLALVQPLFVGDLARALVLSAAEGVAAGGLVELGGPERMTLLAWVERVAEVLGVKARIIPLPVSFALLGAALVERFVKEPPMTVDQVRVMGHNFIAPLEGVEANFGFAPLTPAEGLKLSYGAASERP